MTETTNRLMTASELYARCLGESCEGKERCHWCGSPCSQKHLHDDLPMTIGVKSKSRARIPSSPWVCKGCWLWRRQRVTANWLAGGQRDSTFAGNLSWLFFDKPWGGFDPGPYAINWDGFKQLYHFLLKPPGRWCLTLRADCGGWKIGHSGNSIYLPDNGASAPENLLHVAECNDAASVEAGTAFKFTLNNVVHEYSPYELEQGLRHGKEGKEPGVRVLIELLGPLTLPPITPPPGDGKVGRPYPDTAHRTLGKKLK